LLEFSNFASCGNCGSISLSNLCSLLSHMLVIVFCLQLLRTATTYAYCVSLALHRCNIQYSKLKEGIQYLTNYSSRPWELSNRSPTLNLVKHVLHQCLIVDLTGQYMTFVISSSHLVFQLCFLVRKRSPSLGAYRFS